MFIYFLIIAVDHLKNKPRVNILFLLKQFTLSELKKEQLTSYTSDLFIIVCQASANADM